VIRNLEFIPFGPRTRAELPPYDSGTAANTVISTRAYNLRGQVSALEVTSPLGDVLDQSFSYGYIGGAPGPVDGGPNLDQVVDNQDPAQSRFYFYDDLDRLWKSTNLSGTALFTYLYDANGNRTQQIAPAGTTNYSYASSTDRIAEATGAAAKHYAHDAFGSRIWAGPTAYTGQPSHLYDQGNRLVEVRDPMSQTVLGQYTYDAAGRRVRKVAGGVTTLYFYDAAGHLVESQNLSTSPATRRSYVFVEDEPMGIVDQPPSGAPVFSWIHTDRLGTPLAVTSTPASGSAKTVWRATYEPFGLATPDEDPDGDSASFSLDLRFPGQVFDGETGSHQNYFRDYDPALGRYIESDPIGLIGGLNLYAYVASNPLRFSDPMGWETPTAMGPPPPPDPAVGALWRTFEEMKRKNVPGTDQFFHCLAACRAAKESGQPGHVRYLLNWKERGDYVQNLVGRYGRRRLSHQQMLADMNRDRAANEVGLQCPVDRSCEDQCASLLDGLDPQRRPFMSEYRTNWPVVPQ